jgi:phosphate uptake regulator
MNLANAPLVTSTFLYESWRGCGPSSVPSYLDLIFVARALERIGDHATNIAEDSFWRDQAADIRHTYGPKKED